MKTLRSRQTKFNIVHLFQVYLIKELIHLIIEHPIPRAFMGEIVRNTELSEFREIIIPKYLML